MTTDSSPDVQIKHWHRKVPLNVGASLDKIEECRNFNLRGLLGSLAAVCNTECFHFTDLWTGIGQRVVAFTSSLVETSGHSCRRKWGSFFPPKLLSKWSPLLLTASTIPSSLPSRSERSIDPPRVSFSTSSGLWLFSNSPRPVWPDRGRFQMAPDSDETPPLKSRSCS